MDVPAPELRLERVGCCFRIALAASDVHPLPWAALSDYVSKKEEQEEQTKRS